MTPGDKKRAYADACYTCRMSDTPRPYRQHDWPPVAIRHFRRNILRENVTNFAAHWVSEAGVPVSPRTVEAWEQETAQGRPRRFPPLYVRQHMSRVFYRLRQKSATPINIPKDGVEENP